MLSLSVFCLYRSVDIVVYTEIFYACVILHVYDSFSLCSPIGVPQSIQQKAQTNKALGQQFASLEKALSKGKRSAAAPIEQADVNLKKQKKLSYLPHSSSDCVISFFYIYIYLQGRTWYGCQCTEGCRS